MRDMVLVLNFDDAASRIVTRKLRSERIFCKIVPGDIRLEKIREQIRKHFPEASDQKIRKVAGIRK